MAPTVVTRSVSALAALIWLCVAITPAGELAAQRAEPAASKAAADAPTVYVTRTGKKYHRDGCASLSRSRIPMTLAAAAASYGACLNCKPPTLQATPASKAPVRSPSAVGGRCQATTKKGTQCSRRATRGAFCWQHAG